MAIKLQLGKLHFKQSYKTIGPALEASDILILPISFEAPVQVRQLPLHHRDPFDRMLIAQAITQSLSVISNDKAFDAYPVERCWV